MFSISQGPVSNPDLIVSNDVNLNTNGLNEIIFTEWPDGECEFCKVAFAQVTASEECHYDTPGYQGTCIRKLVEADIVFNPNEYFYNGTTEPSGCWDEQSAIKVLNHELGHALGLRHETSSNAVMNRRTPYCDYRPLQNEDYNGLKRIYPSLDTAAVDVQSPYENQVVIINQPTTFKANVYPLYAKNQKPTKDQFKGSSSQMVWSSSEDGIIANGNDVEVSGLSPGLHHLTVTIGEPGDAVYGEGFSSFYVIDTTSDIVDAHGRTVAFPFPCVRSVSRNDDACLFTELDGVDVAPQFLHGCTYHPYTYDFNPWPYSEDFRPNGNGVRFDLIRDSIPNCDISIPTTESQIEYFSYSSWVRDELTPNSVDYHLYSQINELSGGIWQISNSYFENMPLVEPDIYVAPIEDCQVSNVTRKCGVTIQWGDKYFLPDAGVFYKPAGSSSANYQLLKTFPDQTNGSMTTAKVVGVEGVDLAVFQYAHHVREENSRDIIIRAPDGLMAGPFRVKAISTDTTPADPDLQAVATTCANNYCIELSGEHFGLSSYVDIHVDLNGGGFLKRIAGHDIYSRSDDHIMFPIQDLDLQNRLRNQGLCFWVVNPPEFSEGMCTTRPVTPDPAPFMGQTVERYEPQDLEHTSFEVNNNGTELAIWGNSWKKIAANYTVTPNTVLEFEFKSTQQQARINGVGFIMSGSSGINQERAWQVYGTRTDWGQQSHHNYSGDQWQTYRIPVGEQFTGQVDYMVFIGDEDQHVGQHVVYRQPRLFEDTTGPVISSVEVACSNHHCVNVLGQNFAETASLIVRENVPGSTITKEFSGHDVYSRSPLNGQERLYVPTRDPVWQHRFSTNGLCFQVKSLNRFSNEVCLQRPSPEPMGTFMDAHVQSYADQDHEPEAYVVKDNNLLKLWGNSWKKIDRQYNVTANTVLEFEFKSNNQEASINGIGFIMKDSHSVSSSRVWQVHGTRTNWGHQSHHNYAGSGWQTYQIPVGQTFTGLVTDLVFIADEDVHVGQNTLFRNVRLAESVPSMLTGYMYDPIYSGHGLHLSKNLAGTHLAMFFTYDHSGKPEWFMSSNTAFAGNRLSGDFVRVTFDQSAGSTSTENVGHFSIDYAASAVDGNVNCDGVDRALNPAVFQWNISGQVGSWCVQPIFKQSDQSISIPAKDSGVWYQQNSPGWGMTLQTRLKLGEYDSYAAMFFYDSSGAPRWAAAPAQQTQAGRFSYDMAHHNGYRRNTSGSVTQVISGHMSLDFTNGSVIDFDIDYPLSPLGNVSRNQADMVRLAY